MDRRTFLTRVGVVGTAATLSPTLATSSERYHNPVFDRVFADPAVIGADAYYAYGTYNDWGQEFERRLIPIVRSEDLVRWEYVGEAFEAMPDWRDDPNLGLWAPDVVRLDDQFVLYYSYAKFGDPNPGIGVATAPDPSGPFDDQGKLLQSAEINVPNSIDPCPFVADRPYLFWGSRRGLYGIALSGDGLRTVGDKFQVAGDGVEAAYVIEHEDRYYCFGSRGTCCEGAESTYRVVVGRADSLTGPYVNRASEPLLDGPGTTVLEGNEEFAGPGHCSVTQDDAGTDWLLYHAYERSEPWVGPVPRRVLMLDRLSWEDGWPAVGDGSPSGSAQAPETGD